VGPVGGLSGVAGSGLAGKRAGGRAGGWAGGSGGSVVGAWVGSLVAPLGYLFAPYALHTNP
jgi:hypothetical protein